MFLAKQISSLHKVRETDSLNMSEVTRQTVLRGEIITQGRIFNQDCYFHGYFLKSEFRCSDPLRAG